MDDKLWWHLARASGLTAWVLVSATVLWGLVLSTRILGGRLAPAWLLDLHRGLGALTVVFTGVHLGGLALDEWTQFGPAELLVPLAARYRPVPVAWGIVAMYLLAAISLTSWVRRWIPDRLWRWVHASAHGVFVLATLHTLTAGTDARVAAVRVFAVTSSACYLFLATYRLAAGRRDKRGGGPVRRSAAAVPRFHSLRVSEIRRETADAVSVTLDVPEHLRETFTYAPGQFLTIRHATPGSILQRQYSICSGLAERTLRIAVRHVPGGAVSRWINEELAVGDELHVARPEGRFTTALRRDAERRVLGIAAGSGVTPVLSILASVLSEEPGSRAVLVLGNKAPDTVMLAADIEQLQARSAGRLTVVHQFSRECPGQSAAGIGRLDARRLTSEPFVGLRLAEVDEAFLCGPSTLVEEARAHLLQLGLRADLVKSESFDRARPASAVRFGQRAPSGEGVELVVVSEGQETPVVQRPGDSILDAGLASGLELPFSCMAGSCGTCIARVTTGTVDPGAGELTAAERADSKVLTCQARAVSPGVRVDYAADSRTAPDMSESIKLG